MNLVAGSNFSMTEWNSLQTRHVVLVELMEVDGVANIILALQT